MKKKRDIIFLLCLFLFFMVFLYIFMRRAEGFIGEKPEKTAPEKFNKTIWIQVWNTDSVPWLQQQVAKSWEINNPSWKVEYVTLDNLKDYVTDIDYVYKEDITPQDKTDIIGLSLLKNRGGVWADSTCLCMQPLDNWLNEIIEKNDFWAYHGTPCSWFMVSKKDSYMITKLKEKCDEYRLSVEKEQKNDWMDGLFKDLYDTDEEFKTYWNNIPNINANDEGQSYCLHSENNNDRMTKEEPELKSIFLNNPPYVLKLWDSFNAIYFPDPKTEECKKSVAYYAIQLSKRRFSM
jgi:hypothetical protein